MDNECFMKYISRSVSKDAEQPYPRFLNKVCESFENWGTNPEIKSKNIWPHWTEGHKNSKFFLNPLSPIFILLPGMANSICSSKCTLQKQGRNAAIVPSYHYLAICGLCSSCTETVPTGLTTLVKFSLNHFSNHFNFWDECNYTLQERTFCFT